MLLNEDIWWEMARIDQYPSWLLNCRVSCVILPEKAANWNTAFITEILFFFVSPQITLPSYYLGKIFNTRSKLLCFLLKGTVWYLLTTDHGALRLFADWVVRVGKHKGTFFSMQSLGFSENSGLPGNPLRCPMDLRFLWYLHNTASYCTASGTSLKVLDRMQIWVC